MKKDTLKTTLEMLLSRAATQEEAKFLKKEYGITRPNATKGVLLMAALLDMAVHHSSVPAVKEILALICEEKPDTENGILEALIADLKEA